VSRPFRRDIQPSDRRSSFSKFKSAKITRAAYCIRLCPFRTAAHVTDSPSPESKPPGRNEPQDNPTRQLKADTVPGGLETFNYIFRLIFQRRVPNEYASVILHSGSQPRYAHRPSSHRSGLLGRVSSAGTRGTKSYRRGTRELGRQPSHQLQWMASRSYRSGLLEHTTTTGRFLNTIPRQISTVAVSRPPQCADDLVAVLATSAIPHQCRPHHPSAYFLSDTNSPRSFLLAQCPFFNEFHLCGRFVAYCV
jgi:hypothetical protein